MNESPLEIAFEYWWGMLAPPDSPDYEREYKFAEGRKYSADFAWPAYKLLVEIDGGQSAHRGGRHNTDTDRDKLNFAAILGYRVLRFSGSMLSNDPAGCVETVLKALGMIQSE